MMKKILCLILALTCAFALFACGECEQHVDADKNGKCDECEVDYTAPCAKHTDANSDGKCDVCSEAYSCPGHVDANDDSVCDECGADYVSPENAFFAMVNNSKPNRIVTQSEFVYGGETYTGMYETIIVGNDFVFTYEQEYIATDFSGGSYKDVATKTVEYMDGRYSVDGGEWTDKAPDIQYINIKLALTKANIGEFTFSRDGKTLTATLTAEQITAIFGIANAPETAELQIKTNGKYLSNIVLTYGNTSIRTSYTYEVLPEA